METNSEDEEKILTRTRMHNRFVLRIIVFIFCLITTFCILLVSIQFFKTDTYNQLKNETTKKGEYASYKNEIETNEYRLPKDLVPYYYDLKFFTSFNSFTQPTNYNGTVEINFNCRTETNKIVLNAYNIAVKKESIMIVDIDNGDRYAYSRPIYNHLKQILIIPLLKNLKSTHNYSIYIEYQGFLLFDNAGLYQASYIDAQNQSRYNM
jgi:flagellar basal body-associated protein FliL